MRGTLFIFLKAPIAGRVKTRLARTIGAPRAAALFRVMSANTIARASAGPWRTVLAVDPLTDFSGWPHLWPRRFDRLAQARGDLGVRMAAAFDAAPPGPVVIIGADAPGVRADLIGAAFAALGRHDAVFGPADDGGYWLIGLARRRAAPNLFGQVRWSSEHALADTLGALPTTSSVGFVDRLRDLDDADDLAALGASAFFRSCHRAG
jgi:rSAM/selenodomain-associated transferase 1